MLYPVEKKIDQNLLAKINEIKETDSFYNLVGNQKSLVNRMDTFFKELQTLTTFYCFDESSIGKEFETIQNLIFELSTHTNEVINSHRLDDSKKFTTAVEGQKSLISFIDHLVFELRTTLFFYYYEECHQMGIEEHFSNIIALIEEFFGSTDSLYCYRI